MKQSILPTFTARLLEWHHSHNDRTLPWKGEQDPYRIWLSEIILQQTRAMQGLPYYLSFIEQYPNVHDLAQAQDDAVFKLWQGLGYYSRCRNLLKTARIIAQEHNGIFPQEKTELMRLPGIGPYTAAAIASFSYNRPEAVLDGNVYRVLSRTHGIEYPIDSHEGKKTFAALAQSLLDKTQPKAYNQAIMDFGATVCIPKQPLCDDCPMNTICFAYKQGMQDLLPVKQKKIVPRERHFHYLLIEDKDGRLYMEQRVDKDIWQSLFQPFLIERDSKVLALENIEQLLPSIVSVELIESNRQRLTHQWINTYWYKATISDGIIRLSHTGNFYHKGELSKLAIPKSVFSFFIKNDYF